MSATERNSNASLLLLRIMYWTRYARVKRGGFLWIVKSAADWCEETGLNSKQYERAIAHLRQLKLVVTESHLFANKSCTHARLTADMLERIKTFSGGLATPFEGPLDSPNMGNPYVQIDTTLDTTLSLTPPTEAYSPPNPPELSGQPEEELIVPKPTHSSLDVVQGKLNPKGKSKAAPAVTLAIHEWQSRAAEVTGKFQPTFTMKQAGMMKQIITGGPQGLNAMEMIRAVVVDWLTFVEAVKDAKGWKNLPPEPLFSFFHQHRDVAYNFKKTTGVKVPIVKTEAAPASADIFGGVKKFGGTK